jgi:hypothetical protein
MRTALGITVAALVGISVSAPVFAAREGDILRLFDKARVSVLSNESPALSELLLAGCATKERVFLPRDGEAKTDVVVVLESRWLAPKATEALDESVISVVRRGKNAWEIVISAPDSGTLRQAVLDFRKLIEPPKQPLRRKVRSVAVIPIGPGATQAAGSLVAHGRMQLLSPEQYASARTSAFDEIVLWDRSAPGALVSLPQNLVCGSGDTVAWRETKPDARTRTVIAAPNGALLTEALVKLPDLFAFSETPKILASARDLRGIRRVVVSGVGGDPAVLKSITSQATTELRELNCFEVLERDGLTAILSEVALSQAGITSGPDRIKIKQLAAADTLLIVDLHEATGKIEFQVKHERVPHRGPPSRAVCAWTLAGTTRLAVWPRHCSPSRSAIKRSVSTKRRWRTTSFGSCRSGSSRSATGATPSAPGLLPGRKI